MIKIIKKTAAFLIAVFAPCLMYGAEAAQGIVTAESNLNIDVMLSIVSIILLLPLYLSTRTFLMVAKGYIHKKISESNLSKKTTALLLFICFSQFAFGQAAAAVENAERTIPKSGDLFPDNPITWILVIIILLEAMLIVLFSFLTNKFMKQPKVKHVTNTGTASVESEKGSLTRLWERMNRFQPLTAEGQMDTGHSYDGIRELNNITPPWFTFSFIGSIIIAAVYLYVYNVGDYAPNQIEEYNIEMAEAEVAKTKMLAIQGNNVDENNVVLLGSSDIASGQKIFIEKCVACHAAHGGSMPGGVGPNLTDKFWLHGGSIKDIFKTIKYGWQEKGMIAWQDQLSPKQIAQVASFIKSIGGTNPKGAKEAQGEPYTEDGAPGTTLSKDSTATDSSLKVKK